MIFRLRKSFLNSLCQGFTLIEIMIVVSIIGMVSAVAIPSFRKFNDEQVLKNAAAQMTQAFRKIQNNAQSRVNCRDNNPSSGWEVVLGVDSSGSGFYQIVEYCQNILDDYAPYTIEEEAQNLPADIYINTVEDSSATPPLIVPRFTNPGLPDCSPSPAFPDSMIALHYNNSDNFAIFSPLCLGTSQAQSFKFMLRSSSSVTATIVVDRGGSIDTSFE